MKRAILLYSILILSGCHIDSSTPTPMPTQTIHSYRLTAMPTEPKNPVLEEKFELKVGQSVTVADTDLSFQFDSVSEDSRCPRGAVCVWAGNAVVVLKFPEGKVSLNTYSKPRNIIKDAYRITLLSLSPYPIIALLWTAAYRDFELQIPHEAVACGSATV